MEHRRGAHCARGLHDEPRPQHQEANGGEDLGVGHEAHVGQVLLEDRERERARARDADAVGDRRRRRDRDPLALAERQVDVVRRVRLDAEHGDAGEEGPRDRAAARHEPAAPHGRDERVERWHLPEELEGGRALPGHDLVVVVGRHQDAPRLLHDLLRDGGAVVAQAIVEDDLGPVVARGLELERRRVLGHADDRGRPRHPRRERDALGMVARREGDDPPGALPGREREELVERAADLERARALEPFALEEHAVSAGVVERLRRHDGRAVDAPGEAPRGRVDGVERERGGG